ncbi:CoA transferase [Cribrihabitans neustonicus]|uniref:CoA transferase n=1 Tax=Cribrihabitans neustonicus TaxID=1429085 RepID=UPI003B5AC2F8
MTLLPALPAPGAYEVTGEGHLPSAFAVSDLAERSVAAVGLELARLIEALNMAPRAPEVTVDRRLASLWFGFSFAPEGWQMPGPWDPLAGVYRTSDGSIRLHTNLPAHRAAALRVLGCAPEKATVTEAARGWQADALEAAILEQGGAAAALRSRAEWLAHPQGKAVAAEPLIHRVNPRQIRLRHRPEATAARPLAGLKVLDLTRVLAGPVSTRTLAGFGAEVLRIDPPGWDEPGVIPDTSLGKRMAALDLTAPAGRARFEALLAEADVLVHGYRPGALEGLGYGEDTRRRIAPDAVEVTLDAYGWTGPWARRRGFDSLVQMSCGIADQGRVWAGTDGPVPLPVQALDHATGWLMAAAVLSALTAAARGAPVPVAKLSLARTAEELAALDGSHESPEISPAAPADYADTVEHTSWGPGRRLRPPLVLADTALHWERPATACGSAPPEWAE